MTQKVTHERVQYFGVFPGVVASVDGYKGTDEVIETDESVVQRVRVRVAGVDPPNCQAELLPDVLICYSVASGTMGQFSPLMPGDNVVVEFINGDPTSRVIVGRYCPFGAVPDVMKASYPYREGYVSRGGHSIIFDNRSPDKEIDAGRPIGITIISAKGNIIQVREDKDDIQIRNQAGMRISMRGGKSSDDDESNATKGIILEGSYDGTGERYSVIIDEEAEQVEIKSRQGYTATIRDKDAVGGSETKGITLRTSGSRSIVIDETTGKMYIDHDDEVIIDASKIVLDADVDINGNLDVNGEVTDRYVGVPANLTNHDHTYVTPNARTTPPRLPPP